MNVAPCSLSNLHFYVQVHARHPIWISSYLKSTAASANELRANAKFFKTEKPRKGFQMLKKGL
jgi:hypothetical protein